MKEERKINSQKKTAKIAGLMYLLFLIFAIISDKFASFAITDPTVVINKIIANQGLFSVGLISNLLSALFFILAAWALYVLLKPVNKNLALLFLLLNLAGVVIQCLSVLNLFAVLQIFSGAEFLKVFQADQLQALAIFFINLYENGFIIAQIFYGAWLLPLGYLVYKSKFLPKFLGILLIIDFFAILLWFFQFFLLPSYEIMSYPGLVISAVAEFGLTFWLLIKGVKSN